jgi:hypothetical protein
LYNEKEKKKKVPYLPDYWCGMMYVQVILAWGLGVTSSCSILLTPTSSA